MPNATDSEAVENKSSRIVRTALWLGGSALFGSLALVLWNRRVLSRMREAAVAPEKPVRFPDDDAIY